jgi:hypothetical protein
MVTRLWSPIFVAVFACCAHWLTMLVRAPPYHQPSALEMLLALAVVAAGLAAAATLAIGPALFRPCPWPPAQPEDDRSDRR